LISRTVPKVVIFDLDGVLWDSLEIHEKAFNTVAKSNDILLPPYSEITGRSTFEVFEEFADSESTLNSLNNLVSQKQSLSRHYLNNVEVGEEIVSGLQCLSKISRVALVSGSSRKSVDIFLSKIPKDLFEVVITGDDTNASKPDPEPYTSALKALAAEPMDCVVIEDSINGLASAKSAGLPTIHISRENCDVAEIHFCTPSVITLFEAWIN
jgi:beta-phosphoglucomutase-like phosphatase (HAD superfamily)